MSTAARPEPEHLFQRVCRCAGIPVPVLEHRFAPPRRFRFDFAWPDQFVALEVEGGVWTRGRHTRPTGFLRDVEKYNLAVCLGWRVVRCTPDTLLSAGTLDMIRDLLTKTGAA